MKYSVMLGYDLLNRPVCYKKHEWELLSTHITITKIITIF